ncbi:biopolymer transport protein, ExbD/TolR family protein [Pseudooceanicola batsensis HTCC2597]|uniref:Biopolymer transport protein, ExbD/TolR family protein n=1 Tax=Pseudooceanicola batsensis (strain ATCC BAA-863 / DSM 15984 / KCTC 12145 / HTCC2597) TaxID=252305 RepID=A3TYA5_PSEBH|nr:biopolymer transporter ExbD [Pseudooceanicola batsensis]EAQ03139.1 biopolymer transport protein, ExbD/TolR family protein [Pseudooceanicola batsensis HTCC2597]
MKLARRQPARPLISLVPMIDVMLILLVFFMVTSTYLNLDMIPFVERRDEAPAPTATAGEDTATMLVRISADGRTYLRGRELDPDMLGRAVRERLTGNPLLSVVVLPSTRATTQQLVSTLETLTRAGATRVRLMRLEAAE